MTHFSSTPDSDLLSIRAVQTHLKNLGVRPIGLLPYWFFLNEVSIESESRTPNIRKFRSPKVCRTPNIKKSRSQKVSCEVSCQIDLDFKTASTIATSIVHSKLDYSNSLFLNLDSTQIQRLYSSSKTHSHALSPEGPGIIISLLSLNHFTG